MARYSKRIMRKIFFMKCDFCRYYTELGEKWWNTSGAINECDLCGKDVCITCTGEACEDGQLCKECGENHFFISSSSEGVGIINKKTGEPVEWYMDKMKKEKSNVWDTNPSKVS